ncbi:hypothetical protein [Streptomyces sp. TS71-3]|uniref:hypothetical protein n=1 Tax=Streptomyces sp. TS71-3 TaxID=2733862 RepID=UPI001BB42872|nr:hypothetical protein [Streptomyces sp. TS71-3]
MSTLTFPGLAPHESRSTVARRLASRLDREIYAVLPGNVEHVALAIELLSLLTDALVAGRGRPRR